jgi:ubiquinol-cytochrome c reductase cytochrome b subunit
VMGGATMILFLLPWLDRCKVKSIRYRPMLHKLLIAIFAVSFIVLGWLGSQSGSDLQKLVAQILTAYYFGFFILMPFWSRMGQTKAVPERVPSHD